MHSGDDGQGIYFRSLKKQNKFAYLHSKWNVSYIAREI